MDWAWSEFEANKKGFPKGLKHTATKIRKEHPNIEHIAVWHAIVSSHFQKGKLCANSRTSLAIGQPFLPKEKSPENTRQRQ